MTLNPLRLLRTTVVLLHVLIRKVFAMGLELEKLATDIASLENAVKLIAPDLAGVPALQAQLKTAQDALAAAQAQAATDATTITGLSTRVEALIAQIPVPAVVPVAGS